MTSASDLVLVVGATGGVGQLTVAKLLEKGFKVRILTRSAEKAKQMFSNRVEIVVGDVRQTTTLSPAMQNVTQIICCTGTTAFPSARWEFDQNYNWLQWIKLYFQPKYCIAKAKNSPEKVDAEGIKNLIATAPQNLKRFIFVSSCGVLRKEKFPFKILNAFGVLDAKKKGEEAIINSGWPYTIIRPGRLIDGPYTSYDLNTLLRAKTGGKLAIVIDKGDRLSGQTSRIDMATACVESLGNTATEGQVFELINKGPRPAAIDWEALFLLLTKS